MRGKIEKEYDMVSREGEKMQKKTGDRVEGRRKGE